MRWDSAKAVSVAAMLGLGGVILAWHPWLVQFPSVEGLPRIQSLTAREKKWLGALDVQLAANLRYDGSFTSSGVPKPGTGVCTDVVIGGLKAFSYDLRKEMTADIARNASAYEIKKVDRGIDHRRARNQIVFMRRSKSFEPVKKLRPGDIVFWSTRRNGYVDHVGVVGRYRMPDESRSIVHHWPGLPVAETGSTNMWPIIGAFRFIG